MSSDNNTNDAKKRRVDGGGAISSVGGGGDESREDILMSMIHQQMTMMKGMQDEMKSMRKDITNLTKKCDDMCREQNGIHKDIKKLQSKQNTISTDIKLGFYNVSNRFDDVDNKLKYHTLLMKNQKWEYSAPLRDPSDSSDTADFLKQIKKQTDTNVNGEIKLDSSLPYFREFLPHWKEFASAIEQYQYHLESSNYD